MPCRVLYQLEMTENKCLILLTGPPSIGKTTLVRKVCENLVNNHKIVCNGFYTEEVRNPNTKERIGFDVVSFSGKRGILARANCTGKGPFVGKYCVNVKEFEEIGLPLIQPSSGKGVLVIDEVGKMELKSKKFEMSVQSCIMKTILLATVPSHSRQPLPLVEKLKNHPKSHIIVITKENRNLLQHEVTEKILKLVQN